MPGTSTKQCRIFTGETGYLSKDDSTLKATVYDDTVTGEDIIVYDVESKNHAMTWKRVSENRVNNECFSKDLFLDEETNFLIKTEMEFLPGSNPSDGGGGDNIGKYQAVPEISLDGGATWRSRRELGLNLMPFKIHKLQSGDYILPCAKTRGNGKGFHQDIEIFKGVFDKNSQELNWQKLSNISVTPDESACGLAEPHLTSFENGRLIVLLRMGAIIPSQHRAGVPSVKFYSVSDDNGLTWSKPAPLKFDDGKMIYSPRSYQDILRSSKNGRVYAIFNVCDQPTTGCDPRNKLQIMEIDPETCRVKRESLTVIEEKHPECHHLIRYSNWIIFESRATRNPVLLMRPHMSELCPVRQGYDLNSYRYEIELPEN
jgi:hypothetical protein